MEADMKPVLLFAILGLCAGGLAAEAATQGPATRSYARAEALLAGRTAGTPVSCVSQRLLRSNRSLQDGSILFEANNGIVYVNRPDAGCPDLNNGRILVTRTPSGQLCSGDIVTVREPSGGPEVGSCGLGEFVPYPRPR
jgi:hypothetical protein